MITVSLNSVALFFSKTQYIVKMNDFLRNHTFYTCFIFPVKKRSEIQQVLLTKIWV